MVDTLMAPAIADERLITGEELYALGDIGRCELIAGRIVHMTPTGEEHGEVEFNIGLHIGNFVKSHALGRVVTGEVGIYLKRDPDTIRAADVAFTSRERAPGKSRSGFATVVPDLVVEVVSPNDTWTEISDKLEEYFAAGVRAVWIADPKQKRIHVYMTPQTSVVYRVGEAVPGGALLPGFELPVASVFE